MFSVIRRDTSAGLTAASSCSRSSLVRWATVSKRGSTRIADKPPGAETALPVAASTRPRIVRESAAALPSSPATLRAASTCFEDSSSVFQAGSPPRCRALSDESAAKGERPASISPSTPSSAVREAASRSKAAASPRAAAADCAGMLPARTVSSDKCSRYPRSALSARPARTMSTAATSAATSPPASSAGIHFATANLSGVLTMLRNLLPSCLSSSRAGTRDFRPATASPAPARPHCRAGTTRRGNARSGSSSAAPPP